MARHLITSALPYVSGIKHLGNFVGSLLPADVLARFLRQEGHEVLFVCGTDDHGVAPELAADAAGEDVRTTTDRLHHAQLDGYRRLGLSFDHFGRTSVGRTRDVTLEVYDRLQCAGWIRSAEVALPFSPTDGRFLSDRAILGICPHCGSDSARGDECVGCGALLDPEDLGSPRSALSGATDLEWRPTEHRFLRLKALQEQVAPWVEAHCGDWSPLSASVARAWLAQGLRDRSITRDLDWGIAVPDLPGKVFYCWFDAPLGYLALTAEARPDDWREWWAPGSDVTITQVLGKDNLPFHTLLFPAALLGAGGFRPADRIVGLHWLTWYGQRFSTSERRGVFLDRALEILPADVWRWGLLARTPERSDVDFSWEDLAAVVNKDLVGGFGNLANRILHLARRLGPVAPSGPGGGPGLAALRSRSADNVAALRAALAVPRFRGAVDAWRQLFRTGNQHLEATTPWTAVSDGSEAAAPAILDLLAWLRLVAVAVAPVVPDGAERVLDALHVPADERARTLDWHLRLESAPGRVFDVPPPLYERLDPVALSQLGGVGSPGAAKA